MICADGRRICQHFRPAYQWLMGQMNQRIPGYNGAFPIWFWYSPKPDLRRSGYWAGGQRGLRIELEVPFAKILLSDFNTWHCVLNRWHLSISSRESRKWDRKTNGFNHFNAKLPAPYEDELQSTWERIFDLSLIRRAKLWGAAGRIQGVVDRVLLSEVRDIKEFVAR